MTGADRCRRERRNPLSAATCPSSRRTEVGGSARALVGTVNDERIVRLSVSAGVSTLTDGSRVDVVARFCVFSSRRPAGRIRAVRPATRPTDGVRGFPGKAQGGEDAHRIHQAEELQEFPGRQDAGHSVLLRGRGRERRRKEHAVRRLRFSAGLPDGQERNRPVVRREILRYKRGRYGSPFRFLDFTDGSGYAITNEESFDKIICPSRATTSSWWPGTFTRARPTSSTRSSMP